MARRGKKKTYSQQIAGIATMGLPAPVQKVATSQVGSKLLVLLIPILIATGVITISFSGGMPKITFNRDRAAVLEREVSAEALKAAERLRQYGDTNYR